MTHAPKQGVTYELKAVEGSWLVTLLSFPSMERSMRAAPNADDRMLSIWAVPESGGNASLVAVKNKGDKKWILIEAPRGDHEAPE